MASRTIEIIPRSGLQDLKLSDDASITDFESVSSYSWIDAPTPTIAVPGSPPLWTPPATNSRGEVKIPRDPSLYVTENAVRLPATSMTPIFRAVFTTNPAFDVRSIDVISDRYSIRKLLLFVGPDAHRPRAEWLNVKLEMVANTLILCHREEPRTKHTERWGFGPEFEKAFTTKQIDDSTDHYRIASYRFCGLKLMIRHKTDAFVRSEADIVHEGVLDRSPRLPQPEEASPAVYITPQRLTVLKKGKTIPLEYTMEIRRHDLFMQQHYEDDISEVWLSQTPRLVQAHFIKDNFFWTQPNDAGDPDKKWERRNQKNLRTLGALIDKIITVMKGCRGRGTLRYDVATASLIISSCEGNWGMVPKDLYCKWDE
ncbi:hypothetical protein E4U34_005631 [Claviceps purpurea]|nr:hypothetical protein E4U34_005631 [Claviceps purpurea]